jgi:hypothetical protein
MLNSRILLTTGTTGEGWSYFARNVLMANASQVIISIFYLMVNDLFTRISIIHE